MLNKCEYDIEKKLKLNIMIITKVSRSYSRSINTRQYGAPESWVKIESTYEATCESGDNPMEVSKMIYEQAQKEVVDGCKALAEKVKSSLASKTTSLNPSGPTGPRTL